MLINAELFMVVTFPQKTQPQEFGVSPESWSTY